MIIIFICLSNLSLIFFFYLSPFLCFHFTFGLTCRLVVVDADAVTTAKTASSSSRSPFFTLRVASRNFFRSLLQFIHIIYIHICIYFIYTYMLLIFCLASHNGTCVSFFFYCAYIAVSLLRLSSLLLSLLYINYLILANHLKLFLRISPFQFLYINIHLSSIYMYS